jgi:hypothetical protein
MANLSILFLVFMAYIVICLIVAQILVFIKLKRGMLSFDTESGNNTFIKNYQAPPPVEACLIDSNYTKLLKTFKTPKNMNFS